MNERINELAEQAGYSKDYLEIGLPSNMEKFAELIVKECANMAESFHRHQYDFTGNLELHEFIKTHFGVEE
jgi:hypothetical protein